MNTGHFSYPKPSTHKIFESSVLNHTKNLIYAEEFDSETLDANWTLVNYASGSHDQNKTVPSAHFFSRPATATNTLAAMLIPLPRAENLDIVLEFSHIAVAGRVGLCLTTGNTAGAGTQNFLTYYLPAATARAAFSYTNFLTVSTTLLNLINWFTVDRCFVRATKIGSSWYESWSADGRIWSDRRVFTPVGALTHVGMAGAADTALEINYAYHSFRMWSPEMPVDAIGKQIEYKIQP